MQDNTSGNYQLFSPIPSLEPLHNIESVLGILQDRRLEIERAHENMESERIMNTLETVESIQENRISRTTITASTTEQNTNTEEEMKEMKERTIYIELARKINDYLQENDKMYNLTKYTLFEIDGIQANIYISRNTYGLYYYRIISKNIEYDEANDEEDVDFVLYEKEEFTTVGDLLKDIKEVESNYKFMDFYLLSPEKMEKAKLHRFFLPLPADKICSVCYEPTLEYTTCKHAICLKCREKCILKQTKNCPICRKAELRYYPYELAGY
jgi:hypothetical protein